MRYFQKIFQLKKLKNFQLIFCVKEKFFWIDFYNSYKEGYNATIGGEGTPLYNYKKIEQLLKEGKLTNEICKEMGCCKDVVHKVSKQSGIPLNLPINRNKLQQEMMKSKIAVNQYDKKENFIQSFNSYADAPRWLESNGYVQGHLNGVRTKIGQVCKGERKTAYKFIWKIAE